MYDPLIRTLSTSLLLSKKWFKSRDGINPQREKQLSAHETSTFYTKTDILIDMHLNDLKRPIAAVPGGIRAMRYKYLPHEEIEAADRVFINAKVYSVALDDTVTRAEAVAVKNGKIIYVGTDEGASSFIGKRTKVTDCMGNTLLPGFGDGHMHICQCTPRYVGVSFIKLQKKHKKADYYIRQIQKLLTTYREKHPDARVIHGFGWDRGWFDGSLGFPVRPFTRKDIDAVVSDIPVMLFSYCGHVVLLNSKALEDGGLLHTGVEQVHGGLIRIGEDGIPDGYVQETAAINNIRARTPSIAYTKEDVQSAITSCLSDLAKQGLTLATDYLYDKTGYEVISKMAKEGNLTLRVRGSFTLFDKTAEDDLAYAVKNKQIYDVDDVMKVDTAKFFIDGNYALREPYTPETCKNMGWDEDFCGELLWDTGRFNEFAAAAQKAGFNLHAHAMGDRAVDVSAAVFSSARKSGDPEKKRRNVIVHLTLVSEEAKQTMADAGIVANVQPLWTGITAHGNESEYSALGKERFVSLYPYQSIIDHGVTVACGSDFPVSPSDLFGGIQTAVTRLPAPNNDLYELCKNDPVVNPSECVSLQDAIKSNTINVAYELGLEDVTGTIEPDKSADLILLDRNLENTPVDKICETKVLETVFRGNTVYKSRMRDKSRLKDCNPIPVTGPGLGIQE